MEHPQVTVTSGSNTITEVEPERRFFSELNALRELFVHHEKVVADLEQRLAPLACEPPPPSPIGESEQGAGCSTLSCDLIALQNRLVQQTRNLSGLLDRLEI